MRLYGIDFYPTFIEMAGTKNKAVILSMGKVY